MKHPLALLCGGFDASDRYLVYDRRVVSLRIFGVPEVDLILDALGAGAVI